MARSNKPQPPEPAPELVVFQDEAASKLNDRIVKGEGLRAKATQIRTSEEVDAYEKDYETWTSYNEELLKRIFSTNKYAEEYTWWGSSTIQMRPPTPSEKLESVRNRIDEKLHRLASIRERLDLIPLASTVSRSPAKTGTRPHTNKVFVVHGHDDGARLSVARFLDKLGIEAVILHEQATEGRTLVEKLEHYGDVDFAVVLLTPDDVGADKSEPHKLQPRARQNVIVELGFFVGKLGRKRVCPLFKGPLELPSDYLGVVYVPLDDAGGWRLQLAKELRSSGFEIDMNLAL